jgi:hypothetical protein
MRSSISNPWKIVKSRHKIRCPKSYNYAIIKPSLHKHVLPQYIFPCLPIC